MWRSCGPRPVLERAPFLRNRDALRGDSTDHPAVTIGDGDDGGVGDANITDTDATLDQITAGNGAEFGNT